MEKKFKIAIFLLLVLELIFLLGHIYYQNYYWKGRKLRVAESKESPLCFFSPYGQGIDYSLASLLAKEKKLSLIWKRVNTFEQAFNLLEKREVDLVVGVPTLLVENKSNFKKGKEYVKNNFLFVHNKKRYPLRRFDELCKSKVIVPKNSIFVSKITDYDKIIFCSINYEIIDSQELDAFRVLEANKARFMLTDKIKFNALNPYFLDLRPTYEFKQKFAHLWLWSTHYASLSQLIAEFWEGEEVKQKIKDIQELYLGFFPEDIDFYQLNHLQESVLRFLPRYEKDIIAACKKYDLDPLFFLAQIYQESHFNPRARSRTGVRGLLQLSLDTASLLGIENRLNPTQSIWGGAKYMAFLEERVEQKGVKGWDKWFFVLAAYNQGLGHLYDAMDLAVKQNKNPYKWSSLKEVYPLLSYKKFYKNTKHGYCRGYEAVDYVQSVRYYYYILNLFTFLGSREGDYLRRFVSLRPLVWPR
ncbi:MAG: Lytic transglycosylase catalytic [Desulfonauticus sp. 38_4375]|jgi:membrane-bound lytic murein transglycosylase F|nr:MAG: Lytic transglycosylase catalytic [Desulfonauticus sp. 38_4375]